MASASSSAQSAVQVDLVFELLNKSFSARTIAEQNIIVDQRPTSDISSMLYNILPCNLINNTIYFDLLVTYSLWGYTQLLCATMLYNILSYNSIHNTIFWPCYIVFIVGIHAALYLSCFALTFIHKQLSLWLDIYLLLHNNSLSALRFFMTIYREPTQYCYIGSLIQINTILFLYYLCILFWQILLLNSLRFCYIISNLTMYWIHFSSLNQTHFLFLSFDRSWLLNLHKSCCMISYVL